MKKKWFPRPHRPPDLFFIGIVVLLLVFGFVMLTSASSDLAQDKFNDSWYYLRHQLLNGFSIGILGFFVGLFCYYRIWERLSIPMLLISLLFIMLVWSPLGVNLKGGERWLSFGFFSFQPSELLKLTFLIYLGSWFARSKTRSKSFLAGLLPFLILVGAVMLLLLAQPSTSTAIIIFAAAVITYFIAGARFHFLAATLLVAAMGVSLLVYLTPYRMQRVLTFLNPTQDELGTSYHINQALIAIGSGGWTGVGFGKSTTKLHYLPEPVGDSIFAVVAEELGFVGAGVLILLFFLYVWRGLAIARRAPDAFARLIAAGFSSLIGVQAFVNIAAISGVIPMTGVPLPFVSYGGTALAVFLTMSGIIANISRYR